MFSKIVPSRRDYDPQDTEYTCQAAAIAMVTGGDEMTIRRSLENAGSPGDPAVMGNYLRDRVKEYKFNIAASLLDFIAAIDNGYQLITHGWFSHSGHVIKVSGYQRNPKDLSYSLIVDDPYEEFDAISWKYHRDYRSGNNSLYSSYLMYATCVKGRSFDDARRIYRKGELDSALKGAWLHMIKV